MYIKIAAECRNYGQALVQTLNQLLFEQARTPDECQEYMLELHDGIVSIRAEMAELDIQDEAKAISDDYNGEFTVPFIADGLRSGDYGDVRLWLWGLQCVVDVFVAEFKVKRQDVLTALEILGGDTDDLANFLGVEDGGYDA